MSVHQWKMAGQALVGFKGTIHVHGCIYWGVAVIEEGKSKAGWKQQQSCFILEQRRYERWLNYSILPMCTVNWVSISENMRLRKQCIRWCQDFRGQLVGSGDPGWHEPQLIQRTQEWSWYPWRAVGFPSDHSWVIPLKARIHDHTRRCIWKVAFFLTVVPVSRPTYFLILTHFYKRIAHEIWWTAC